MSFSNPKDRLITALNNAFTMMRGTRITKEEYDEICKLMEDFKSQVLFPAAVHDIATKDKK